MENQILGYALGRNVKVSPTKVRPVIKVIKGKKVSYALAYLDNERRRSNPHLHSILKSAIANAVESKDVDADELYVLDANVNLGRTLKRIRPRAMGRGSLIRKRSSHIKIGVGLMEAE